MWFSIKNFSFFIIGAITCILSLICALALAYLDQRAERILHKEQGKTGKSTCKGSGTLDNYNFGLFEIIYDTSS